MGMLDSFALELRSKNHDFWVRWESVLRSVPLFLYNQDLDSDPRNQQLDDDPAWVDRLTYDEDDCVASALMVNKVELHA